MAMYFSRIVSMVVHGFILIIAIFPSSVAFVNAASEIYWDYKGMTYVSWTKGDYPWTTSWKAQTYYDSQAIEEVYITSECARSGAGGLAMVIDLIGGDPNKRSGEAVVDLRYYPPLLEQPCCLNTPLNMYGVTICAYVWCPPGSRGDPNSPNGIQLLVKSDNWKSLYGPWRNIEEDQWNHVCVTVGHNPEEQLFDPTRIVLLGVKVGAGSESTETFSGIMCLDDVSWTTNGCQPTYTFDNIENSLERITGINVNYISLINTWYMEHATSYQISPHDERTHDDAEMIATIQKIHEKGMGVLLKPHVDILDGTWRGLIDPGTMREGWFTEYGDFITHFAQIAQATGVEILCIGTELESMVIESDHSNWIEIINEIKQIYSGQLIYAANWDGYHEVPYWLWDRMDILGIDAYFPLSNELDPSLEDIITGWSDFCFSESSLCYSDNNDEECHNWTNEIESWQATIGKPVVFTEIGYQSADGSAATPWDASGTTPNMELQERCYEAAFRVFNNKYWFMGVFWWAAFPWSDAGGLCDLDFSPQNKPAEDVVSNNYEYPIQPNTYIALGPRGIVNSLDLVLMYTGEDDRDPPSALQFSFKLDDSEWSGFSSTSRCTLSDLDEGEHIFRVRSQDRDGNIDPTPAECDFLYENWENDGEWNHLVTGPGPGPNNPPLVRTPQAQWEAYSAYRYGVNVASGNVTQDATDEIITGPGPGSQFGPHVRGWFLNGSQVNGLNFLAYGTHRYGVNVATGDVDNDGFDEIITGAGPGRVFGPHVRAFDYDGAPPVEAIPGISFFAYGTHKWGVNIACGNIDGDDYDEIITGAGPGPVFGPHVRGWNYDGSRSITAIAGVSFLAYGTNRWGVNVACGDIDGDGFDEIITGPGPGPDFASHVKGWDYDNSHIEAIPGISFIAYSSYYRYGAVVAAGDVDEDGTDEIITMPGPGECYRSYAKIWKVDGGTVIVLDSIEFAYDNWVTYGGSIDGGKFD